MKKLLFLLLIPFTSIAQDFPSGMVAVEFNASFNKSNEVAWLSKLSDCETERVDITSDSRWSKEYKVVVVPTIVIFNNNEEVKRLERAGGYSKQKILQEIDVLLLPSYRAL